MHLLPCYHNNFIFLKITIFRLQQPNPMIPFFRKIRKKMADDNRPLKYMRYAIGEILLVVVGILIALYINNWNQDRSEQSKIKDYAMSLIQDLERDILMTHQIKLQNEEIIARIDSLNKYVFDRKIENMSNLTLLYLTLNKPHRPYVWNRTTISELKNSGALGLINNDSLSKMISKYDAFTYHLDDDFINDRIQFEKATELSGSVVNTNYPNIYEFSEMLLPNNNLRDRNFFNSPEYLEAKSMDIRMITEDLDKVLEMTSSYNVLMIYLRIRTDEELPKLTNNAKDITALLKKTYLE